MMLPGANPVYAGIHQFNIVAKTLTASGIPGLMMTLLMRAFTFAPSAKLMTRSRSASRWPASRWPISPLAHLTAGPSHRWRGQGL